MSKKAQVLGMIPARFGSTRFPGKPLAKIGDKTLIQRTFENAKRCPALADIIVATDDTRIFDHVKEFGGRAVMTSPSCSNGTERLAEAVNSESELSRYDILVNIQGDEPLLEPEVIEQTVETLANDKDAAVSTAAVKIRSKEEALSYSATKCVMDRKGYALYFSRALIPDGHTGEWRENIIYYKHLGIYCYRRDFLLLYPGLESTPLQKAEDLEQLKILEHGYRIKVAIVESRSIGIDKPEDLKKIIL